MAQQTKLTGTGVPGALRGSFAGKAEQTLTLAEISAYLIARTNNNVTAAQGLIDKGVDDRSKRSR